MKFKWYQLFEEADGDGGDLGGADPVDNAPTDPTPTPAPTPATPTSAAPAADKDGDWPADWRTKLSPDGKHAKTLERFASPKAVLDSYLSLRQKVDSGELKAVSDFPSNGTPEQQAEWRKAHGVPDSAEGYELEFDDGLVIGENDKEIVSGFLKAAHESNASPTQVNKILHWYYKEQERMLDAQEEKDAAYLQESEDILRAEWGQEYRVNVNIIRGLVDTLPESVRDAFVNARLGDGTALLNNPDMARWLVHTGRTINPVATIVPGAGANMASAIEDEIESIEKVMRENRAEYNRNEKMQSRLRDLYDARERAKR